MKNLLESFAVFLVGLLSLLIVYLIVQYNMIEDQMIEEIEYTVSKTNEENKEEKTKSYLDDLEGYGEDVDVEVDATKESTENTVIIKSEEKNNDLGDVVEDKSKSSYTESLEGYGEDVDVKVDATKDNSANTVVVESEDGDDALANVVADKSKSTYTENLKSYDKKAKDEKLDESEPVVDAEGEPERLDQEEVEDTFGLAIDAALDDL